MTTVTDLLSGDPLTDEGVDLWTSVVEDDAFPARVSQFLIGDPRRMGGHRTDVDSAARRVADLAANRSGKKMHYGGVKLMLDGSIQGYTACLQNPGYYRDPSRRESGTTMR
ncbi:hypothetical protein [uncultured Bifidobacterium sp.]|uniref:hypothetical protein n=1 Tax=uncultured Bifidobacterium sp. TaxID=165187 RepID=UPI0028DD3998|nr:hypothetical protein [uncultured Bifidobacterium sp.]